MRKSILTVLAVVWAFALGFQVGRNYGTSQAIDEIKATLAKRNRYTTSIPCTVVGQVPKPVMSIEVVCDPEPASEQITTEPACPADATCTLDRDGNVTVLSRGSQ